MYMKETSTPVINLKYDVFISFLGLFEYCEPNIQVFIYKCNSFSIKHIILSTNGTITLQKQLDIQNTTISRVLQYEQLSLTPVRIRFTAQVFIH